jgi:hypothetical protein
MAQNVRFVRTTKEKQINRQQYDKNALYFCTDSKEFYRGDQLLTDGIRIVDTLPELNVAADGILYFIEDTKNGYVLNTSRDGWVQIIYASASTGGNTEEVIITVKEEILNTVYTKEEVQNLIADDVKSIMFAGVEMTEVDGVFSIDKDAALDAIGLGDIEQWEANIVYAINFAGTDMVEIEDGIFGIDRESALDALGISVPTSVEGEPTIIATETVVEQKVTAMSDELKTYIDEQVKNVEVPVESMDGGEFT